jgi:hypothetical protein
MKKPKLPNKRDVKPSPADAPGTEPLPANVEVTPSGITAVPATTPKVSTLDAYLDSVYADHRKAIKDLSDPQNRVLYISAMFRLRQAELLALGWSDTMQCPAHPLASEKLLPAVNSLITMAPEIMVAAPLVLDGISIPTMQTDADFLTFLGKVKEKNSAYGHGLDTLQAKTEQSLDERVRIINTRGGQLILAHFEMNNDYSLVRNYLSDAAKQAEQTKKAMGQVADKAATDAEQNLLQKLNGQNPAGTATQGTPGTTAGTPGAGTPPQTEIPPPPQSPAPLKKGKRSKART